MKLKNRGNVYAVVRHLPQGSDVVGVFDNLQTADDYSDACLQAWIDKTGSAAHQVEFEVQLSTYYG